MPKLGVWTYLWLAHCATLVAMHAMFFSQFFSTIWDWLLFAMLEICIAFATVREMERRRRAETKTPTRP